MSSSTISVREVFPQRDPSINRAICKMHSRCFSGGEDLPDTLSKETFWWVAWLDGKPVGYAGLRVTPETASTGRLEIAGVLKRGRGRGIQKRLIRSRLRKARWLGCLQVDTYTLWWNYASMNSLIACGFRVKGGWGDCFLTWRRRL